VEQNLQKENKKKEGFGEHWFPEKIKKRRGSGNLGSLIKLKCF
jgi:hypothetical protein